MRAEVSIAVNFVLSFLYNRLPRRRVNLFGEQLDCNLTAKFQGHWYPDQPLKGTAFRCLKISGEQSDPILLEAAKETGLDVGELMKHLPQNLTLWIDPGEVSCRVGGKGSVTQLYSSETAAADSAESLEQQQQEQQQQQQQHPCAIQPLVPDPLWMFQQRQQQQECYTAAAFAQTKFGSKKLRQPPRSHSRPHSHHQMLRQQHQQLQHQMMYWVMPWGARHQQQLQQPEPQLSWQFKTDYNSIWSCDDLSVAIPSPAATTTPTASSTGNSAESSGPSSPLMLAK
ncbi:hypothetical protein BOX15_Mlig011327g1 [Macrostomum lignano]|uniref:Anti-proliferative protein domain-containing protein n=1 Tax=Macrostomum lignano TaxID=282301 RepID=A0A267EL30_9PLAT|nr:hypothetical protein BOX15_Mlig011327g1 [Macrostomum lignano]